MMELFDGIWMGWTLFFTWTGLAARSKPATPPPMTRPSALAKETLIPPDLLLVPPFSDGMNDPDNESNWKRPWRNAKVMLHKVGLCEEIPSTKAIKIVYGLLKSTWVTSHKRLPFWCDPKEEWRFHDLWYSIFEVLTV